MRRFKNGYYLNVVFPCCAPSISPITLVWEPDIAGKLFEKLVDRLFDCIWLTVRISSNAQKQMEALLLAVKCKMLDQCLGFAKKEPLDKFLSKFSHENDKYDCL